jgi:hypothetical protein
MTNALGARDITYGVWCMVESGEWREWIVKSGEWRVEYRVVEGSRG